VMTGIGNNAARRLAEAASSGALYNAARCMRTADLTRCVGGGQTMLIGAMRLHMRIAEDSP
jgi:hypothetical protein